MSKPQQRTLCVSVKPEHLARLEAATVRRTVERGRVMTKSELVREALDLLLPPDIESKLA
jgi:Arc/MetJ-type ribon-helix-helix transcriptional regulator